MSITELTDEELLQRIQRDDVQAFEALYLRLWESLFVFAMKRLGSEDDAEDVVGKSSPASGPAVTPSRSKTPSRDTFSPLLNIK